MREILFRGKRIDDGEWVQGDLSRHHDGRVYVIRWWYMGMYRADRVNPATVGQYTGLTDKNGVKIFEGDIVCARELNDGLEIEFTGVVAFCDALFYIETEVSAHYRWMNYEVEVIGNACDNPSLLKEDNI